MTFKSIQEAFNYWNQKTMKEIEERAAQIKHQIETDPGADVASLNVEIAGLQQAKQNHEERAAAAPLRGFNPITGTSFETRASQEATTGDVFASPEYRSAFFKSLLGQELNQNERAAFTRAQAETRADSFNTLSTNAAVIPTTTLNEIIAKARTQGGLISEVRSFAMPANIAIPIATPAAKADWHTEGAAVESDSIQTENVTFNAYELLKVFSISAAARTMSINAFESYLISELSACIMETIGYTIVNGTSQNQGAGLETITWTPDVNAVVAADDFEYKDVVKTIGLMKRGYSQGAKWAMNNNTLYSQFYGMVDGNKRPIFISDPQAEAVGKILGHGIIIDDNIADNDVYFGDFRYYGYNLPGGIAIDSSKESSFRRGLIDYRALAVADAKPILPEAFVKLYKQA